MALAMVSLAFTNSLLPAFSSFDTFYIRRSLSAAFTMAHSSLSLWKKIFS